MNDTDALLDAVLPHVPFDGWSEAALAAGAADCGLSAQEVRALFPRGPLDAALAYHRRGDALMAERLGQADLGAMRYRDRIAAGVRYRLEVADRELVRRGMSLFSLPQNAADGARAVWQTCDLIWNTLGDTSRDVNWYTKRSTLAAVYSATLLYWLGDDSEGQQATWAFLDRRIEDVMRFESVKHRVKETGFWKAFLKGPGRVLDRIEAPGEGRDGYPGQWHGGGR